MSDVVDWDPWYLENTTATAIGAVFVPVACLLGGTPELLATAAVLTVVYYAAVRHDVALARLRRLHELDDVLEEGSA